MCCLRAPPCCVLTDPIADLRKVIILQSRGSFEATIVLSHSSARENIWSCNGIGQLHGGLVEEDSTCQCPARKRGRGKSPRGSAACSLLMCLCLIRHGPFLTRLGLEACGRIYRIRRPDRVIYASLVTTLGAVSGGGYVFYNLCSYSVTRSSSQPM